MPMFRKKPVVVEAMQYTSDRASVTAIIEWAHSEGDPAMRAIIDYRGTHLLVRTPEGVMVATIGDWVIKGVKGEFYPCKPAIFGATYEPVPDKVDVPPKPKSPVCTQEKGAPLKEFFMTIGVGYDDGSHPLGVSPNGYVVIEATDYEKAREKAFEVTNGKFAFLYEKCPSPEFFPLGEVLRIRVL